MKTIIFVMPRLPFPATSGRKNSLYHYCKIIHNLGYRLIVAAFLESGDQPKMKPNFIDRLVVLPAVSVKEKAINVVRDSYFKGKKPMQVGLFWSKNAKKVIDGLVLEERPVAIISDMVRMTEYAKDISCFKIADLDDLISLRYERQLKDGIHGVNPYGAYLENIPKFLQKILLNDTLKLLVLKHEINLIKKYELQMGRIFDKTVFVAESEAQMLNKVLHTQDKAVAIPIGVDIDYFAEKVQCLNDGHTYVSFLGKMSVAHNESAAIYFIEKVMPFIMEEIPEVIFLIIGGGVTPKLKAYECNNVVITGQVDDVRKYLQSSRVFVCPLTFGSGIKTKNLEAMASGVPVVTTTIGAENIGAIDEKHWLVADDPKCIAVSVTRLINDKDLYESIRICGKKYVQTHWTWDVARDIFANLLPR